MRTYEEKAQQTQERRMSGCDVLMECLRQLHPAVQFDRQCGFFLYILSIGMGGGRGGRTAHQRRG